MIKNLKEKSVFFQILVVINQKIKQECEFFLNKLKEQENRILNPPLNMKKFIVLLLILNFTLVSCFKDEDDTGIFSGVYIEVEPVPGRTQVNFVSNDRLVIIKDDNDMQDEFRYEIEEELIHLTPATEDAPPADLEFHILGTFRFEIGNLYPSLPDDSSNKMIFEKQVN